MTRWPLPILLTLLPVLGAAPGGAQDTSVTSTDAVHLDGIVTADGAPFVDGNVVLLQEYTCDEVTCTELEGNHFRRDVYTDQEGRWNATAPEGGIVVVAIPSREGGRYVRSDDDLMQAARLLTVRAGERITVNLSLPRQPPSDVEIVASVVDLDTGQPLENALVSTWNFEWSHLPASEQTEDNGPISIPQKPGYMRIEASVDDSFDDICPGQTNPTGAADAPTRLQVCPRPANQGRRYGTAFVNLDAAPGSRNDISLEVPRLRPIDEVAGGAVEIRGRSIDGATGEGIPAAIGVYNEEAFEWGRTVANARGDFTLHVRPGPLLFVAVAADHWEAVSTVLLRSPGAHSLELRLPPGEWPRSFCCAQRPAQYPVSLGRFPELGPSEPLLQTPEERNLRQPWRTEFDLGIDDWREVYSANATSFQPLAAKTPESRPAAIPAVAAPLALVGLAIRALLRKTG